MNTNVNSKDILVKEFGFVVQQMKAAKLPQEKMYYYSGAYSMVQRLLNLQYDLNLILIHNVLQTSYSTINQCIQNIASGNEKAIKLPDDFFDELIKALKLLAKDLQQENDYAEALKRITLLTYLTTGNGFYLYQKGLLKL